VFTPRHTLSSKVVSTTPITLYSYGHEQAWHDGNGHSHLQATLLGPSVTVPVAEGKLVLGTWQQIFHLECDVRGRQRTIIVTVNGE
jgi:secondary thiamine-phosphate synthase enzyme